MGRTRTPGLINRAGIWHIDKRFRGRRICESTGESDLGKAQEYLTRRLEEARQASVFGVRPNRDRFARRRPSTLQENQHKRSIGDDALHLRQLDRVHRRPAAWPPCTWARCGRSSTRGSDKGRKSKIDQPGARHGAPHPEPGGSASGSTSTISPGSRAPPKIKLLRVDGCARAVSAVVGRAGAVVSGVADALGADGAVQGQHRLSGSGSLRLAVGVGSGGAGARHQRVHHPRPQGEERGRATGGAEPGGALGDRRRARRSIRSTCSSTAGKPIETMNNTGVADGAATRRVTAGSGARSEAHVRPAAACGGRVVRGPAGSARSSLGAHHDALLGGGVANLIEAANRVCDAGSRKTPALVMLKRKAPAAVAASA